MSTMNKHLQTNSFSSSRPLSPNERVQKSRIDTTQPQSPGSGKSCTFEILDEEQISQGQTNKFEKGCISEDISIRDESTTGT